METLLASREYSGAAYCDESLNACRECGIVFKLVSWDLSLRANAFDNEGPKFCPYCGAELEKHSNME